MTHIQEHLALILEHVIAVVDVLLCRYSGRKEVIWKGENKGPCEFVYVWDTLHYFTTGVFMGHPVVNVYAGKFVVYFLCLTCLSFVKVFQDLIHIRRDILSLTGIADTH